MPACRLCFVRMFPTSGTPDQYKRCRRVGCLCLLLQKTDCMLVHTTPRAQDTLNTTAPYWIPCSYAVARTVLDGISTARWACPCCLHTAVGEDTTRWLLVASDPMPKDSAWQQQQHRSFGHVHTAATKANTRWLLCCIRSCAMEIRHYLVAAYASNPMWLLQGCFWAKASLQ